MKNFVLSVEQMETLETLGLNTSNATMCWKATGFDEANKAFVYSQLIFCEKQPDSLGVPAYTLQDIEDNLPTHETFSEKYSDDFGRYWVRLVSPENDNIHTELSNKSLLDAAYQMLVWVLSNKNNK